MEAPIDTRQLRAFVCLARSGSFTQAGRELHLTQSAISHAIKSLETDLGRLGFTRRDRAMFEKMLQRSHGMILVTGPTGSTSSRRPAIRSCSRKSSRRRISSRT